MLDIISPYFNHGGYYILFLTTFLETALFFGFVVPGESIVVISGLLASKGVLDLKNVLLAASVGAILGDQAGYILGREIGQKIVLKYGQKVFFKKEKEYLLETERFFERHGGKAVFLGRFAAWLRAMSPFVAGISRMRYSKFLFFNVAGGLLWAAVYSLLGYFVGNSWQEIRRFMGRAGFFALITVVVATSIWWLLHKKKHKIREKLGLVDRMLSAQLPLTWGFLKARLSAGRWWGLRLTAALFSVFIAFHEFGEIIESQTRKGLLYRLDVKAAAFMMGMEKTPGLQKIMALSSVIIDFYVLIATAAALVLFLVLKKKWWGLYAYLLALGAGVPLLFLLKIGMGRMAGLSSRFPSTYAFSGIIVFGFLAYAGWRGFRRKIFKIMIVSLSALLALLVGITRLYWDAHWLTDVLGGYAAGFAWLALSIVIVRTIEESVKKKDLI